MHNRHAPDAGADLSALSNRIARSDVVAFETLFRQFRGRLVDFVCGIVKDPAAAQDMVQDVFADLWEVRSSLDPSLSIKALIYRMARNRAYNHMRDRNSHHRKHEELRLGSLNGRSDNDAIEALMDARELDKQLQVWLRDLPERQRDALCMSRYGDLSHAEIARVMDISPRTVNNHIVRALSTLHERLQQHRAVTHS